LCSRWAAAIERRAYSRCFKTKEVCVSERVVGERTVELDDDERAPEERAGGILPDLLKKAVLTGMGALFMTEEGIRNAAGQLKLPKEALAYLLSQADRTRGEVVRVVSQELRRFLESETLRREVWKLLTGVTIEINATVQLKPSGEPGMKVQFKKKKGEGERDGKGAEGPRDAAAPHDAGDGDRGK
jgi:hypothetical protein